MYGDIIRYHLYRHSRSSANLLTFPSPLAYLAFGRTRISRSEQLEADKNLEAVETILRTAQRSLTILSTCLGLSGDSDLRDRAVGLIEVLEESIESITTDYWGMGHFWLKYNGVISRMRMTDDEIRYGLSRLAYWLDGESRTNEALLKVEEAKMVDEEGDRYLRHIAILRRGAGARAPF